MKASRAWLRARGIVMRFDKLARNYRAGVAVASILIWIKTDLINSPYASVISQYPEFVQVAQETANWDQQEAFSKVETLLQSNPDVVGIIAGNDTMALGAVAAVEAAGLSGKVAIAGLDGSPDAVEAVKEGKMVGTAMQPAVLISQLAVEQADSFIRTGDTGAEEKQSIDCVVINADKYTLFEVTE